MNGRNIPGYYYDTQKKKYFRIQDNHVAPEGSKYSRENVKNEQDELKKRKRSQVKEQARRTHTVRRSPLLQSCSPTNRRLGLGFDSAHAWAAGLRGQLQFPRAFDDVKICKYLRAGSTWFYACAGTLRPDDIYTVASKHPGGQDQIGVFTSPVSSLTLTKRNTVCITAQGSSGSWPVAQLLNAETLEDGTVFTPDRSQVETIWCSAPNPFVECGAITPEDEVALGCSGNVFRLIADQSDWSVSSISQNDRAPPSTNSVPPDYWCLSWLSPTLLSSGRRDGKVFLFDVRSGGHKDRYTVRGAVHGISAGSNEWEIVTCALHSNMQVHDLRFLSTDPPQRQLHQYARPLYKFEEYTNKHDPTLGFAVHPSLNVVAAGTSDASLTLWNLKTGRVIRTLAAHVHTTYRGSSPAVHANDNNLPASATPLGKATSITFEDEDFDTPNLPDTPQGLAEWESRDPERLVERAEELGRYITRLEGRKRKPKKAGPSLTCLRDERLWRYWWADTEEVDPEYRAALVDMGEGGRT